MQAIEETLPLEMQLDMIWSQTFQRAKIGGNSDTANIIANWSTDCIEYMQKPSTVVVFSLCLRTSFDDSQKEAHPEMFAEFLGLDSVHLVTVGMLLLETKCSGYAGFPNAEDGKKCKELYIYIIFEKSRLSALWHTDELQIELRFKVSFTEDPSFPPYVLLFFHKEILYFQEPSLQNTS